MRVLLYRECDWTGRRLLFDSSAVQKVSITSNDPSTISSNQSGKLPNASSKDGTNPSRSYIDICNGYGYTYDHALCESSNIGEMVFGSVAMSFKGTSLKVKSLKIPIKSTLIESFELKKKNHIPWNAFVRVQMFRCIGCANQLGYCALKCSCLQYFQKIASVAVHRRTT